MKNQQTGAGPSITYVSLNAYHLLATNPEERGIGGAELQGLLVMSELTRRGYEINVLTYSHKAEDIQHGLPFKTVPAFRRGRGVPLVHPVLKVCGLLAALQMVKTDLYVINAASPVLAAVALSARLRGRKVLFRASSDTNFEPNFRWVGSQQRVGKFFYLWGLRRCDFYAVQNQLQLELLRKNFGREGLVIHNGLPKKACLSSFEGDILWVAGAIREVKNPGMFLELARRIPHGRFVLVGGNPVTRDSFSKSVEEEARRIPNLVVGGFLPFEDVEALFAKASLLVNTSDGEGFPNTFLQAWSRGIPVVSLKNVNPDGLITKYNLGKVVSNGDEMVRTIGEYLEGKLRFSPEAIKAFFDENLTLEQTVDKFEEAIAGILAIGG